MAASRTKVPPRARLLMPDRSAMMRACVFAQWRARTFSRAGSRAPCVHTDAQRTLYPLFSRIYATPDDSVWLQNALAGGRMRRVLVTRPEPGASKTARKLRQMGLEPLLLPLTRIEALPVELLGGSPDFAAIAVTSPNAARHAPPELTKSLSGLPTYAVGKTTAAVSRAIGLNVVDDSAGDAAGLRRVIADKVEPRSKVLVLCGRVRRDILEQGLVDAGFTPRLVEVYDTLSTT